MAGSRPKPGECADKLLATMPELMRWMSGAIRHRRPANQEPHGLGQVKLLHIIDHQHGSLREIAAIHHVTSSTLSRSIDALVQHGWVTRESDHGDRRQIRLALTESGRAVLEATAREMRDTVGQLLQQLTDGECARLFDGLDVLAALISRQQTQTPADYGRDNLGDTNS